MWDAPPATPYFGYGWSRRYMEVLAEFVTQRSDTKVAICRPTAVYGPHDNFDPATSHVIPALIHKAVTKMNPFEVWGTGEDIRDSLHVDDLARGCLLLLQKHAECDPVNIGLGQGHSVRELVEIILAAAGHNDVELNFDASRPTTIPVRLADVSKARDVLGFEPRISLRDGITDTVKWYRLTLVECGRRGGGPRILVTGGTGLVGQAVVAMLLRESDCRPRVPYRGDLGAFHDDPRVEYVRADLTERDSCRGLVADCVGAVLSPPPPVGRRPRPAPLRPRSLTMGSST